MPLKRHEKHAVGFLLRHLLGGAVGGGLFGGLVLYSDIGHLRSLAMTSPDGALYLILFFFGLFVTFGGVAMAAGIMSLARDDESR
jgi:hypothetical protein